VPVATLLVEQLPTMDHPPLVAAFSGWPDAGEVASGAVAYLVRTLGATRFASIDSDPYFLFGEARPHTLVTEGQERALTWPSSEFFSARDAGGRDLVLFLAREPNLRWHDYVHAILELAERVQASGIFSLGGTYDEVSHRGDATVTGWSPAPEMRERLGQLGLRFNTYQGPSSIQSALMEACAKRAVPAASLWGHAPHYVSGAPNPKVAHALLERLRVLLDLDVDLTPLEVAGRDLEAQIEQALLGRDDLRNYVRRLEEPIAEPAQESDSASSAEESAGPVSLPSAESIIDDLESLLRQIREDDEDEDVDVSDQEEDEG
jgi:proteasome assembly chaperone (PAC2) family protein